MLKYTLPTVFVFIPNGRGYSTAHPAIDIGWDYNFGGPNCPLHAAGDGKVVAIQDGYNYDTSKGWGNYIKIDHGGGEATLYAHCLKRSFKVKVGDSVKRGQQIAQMGNSGNAPKGHHVHFVFMLNNKQVNPLLYVGLDESWQVVYGPTDNQYKILRFQPNPAEKYLVERDESKDQLYVTASDLRARKSAGLSGEVWGWMPKGYYNVISTAVKDGYTWCKIADDLYAAVTAGYSEFLAKKDTRVETLEKAINEMIATGQAAIK